MYNQGSSHEIFLAVVPGATMNFFESFRMHRIECEVIGENRKIPAISGLIPRLPAQTGARNQRRIPPRIPYEGKTKLKPGPETIKVSDFGD